MGSVLANLIGCTGATEGACRFNSSHTINASTGIIPISMELKDHKKNFIHSVVETKFSTKALHFVIRGETSSRYESTNRAMNKGLVKKITFSLALEDTESLQPQE